MGHPCFIHNYLTQTQSTYWVQEHLFCNYNQETLNCASAIRLMHCCSCVRKSTELGAPSHWQTDLWFEMKYLTGTVRGDVTLISWCVCHRVKIVPLMASGKKIRASSVQHTIKQHLWLLQRGLGLCWLFNFFYFFLPVSVQCNILCVTNQHHVVVFCLLKGGVRGQGLSITAE